MVAQKPVRNPSSCTLANRRDLEASGRGFSHSEVADDAAVDEDVETDFSFRLTRWLAEFRDHVTSHAVAPCNGRHYLGVKHSHGCIFGRFGKQFWFAGYPRLNLAQRECPTLRKLIGDRTRGHGFFVGWSLVSPCTHNQRKPD